MKAICKNIELPVVHRLIPQYNMPSAVPNGGKNSKVRPQSNEHPKFACEDIKHVIKYGTAARIKQLYEAQLLNHSTHNICTIEDFTIHLQTEQTKHTIQTNKGTNTLNDTSQPN